MSPMSLTVEQDKDGCPLCPALCPASPMSGYRRLNLGKLVSAAANMESGRSSAGTVVYRSPHLMVYVLCESPSQRGRKG
jgi:hypothetical protein